MCVDHQPVALLSSMLCLASRHLTCGTPAKLYICSPYSVTLPVVLRVCIPACTIDMLRRTSATAWDWCSSSMLLLKRGLCIHTSYCVKLIKQGAAAYMGCWLLSATSPFSTSTAAGSWR